MGPYGPRPFAVCSRRFAPYRPEPDPAGAARNIRGVVPCVFKFVK